MSSVRVLLRASVALAIAGGSLAHATNGYLSHGYGIKAKGAAGVGAALPQGTLTIATNPAGLIEAGARIFDGIQPAQSNFDFGLTCFIVHPKRGIMRPDTGGDRVKLQLR